MDDSPRVVHVDAFADAPFTGDPAGVCVLANPGAQAWMQAVAAEPNQPATAFVWPEEGTFGLRWFTAVGELALCGHGTLAAAHALWEEGRLDPGVPARFRSPAGLLTARRDYLVAVATEAEVRAVRPDLPLLRTVDTGASP